jgi:hypothetical protein
MDNPRSLQAGYEAAGWSDTFDDGWRAALVALCDARESRLTRRWAYRAFIYLRQRHADQNWPKGRLPK